MIFCNLAVIKKSYDQASFRNSKSQQHKCRAVTCHFMRELITAILNLMILGELHSQPADTSNIYPQLDTMETYDVTLSEVTGPNGAHYYVNDEEVHRKTYDRYKALWDNIEKCTPCFLKSYDENHVLMRGSVQYTDCSVGLYIEYYPDGATKLIGHFKQNATHDWHNLAKRHYCTIKDGQWTYYDKNGRVIKLESYKEGKLVSEQNGM